MAKTITTTVTVTTIGDGMNHTDSFQVVNAAGADPVYLPAATGNVQFASGAFPGMLGVLMVPASSPGGQKFLKGAGIDTGIQLATNQPCIVCPPAGGGGAIFSLTAVEPIQAVLL